MAQPYVSLRRFTTFVTSLAETVNAKINTSAIKNNDTTTSSGYVADARIVKTHGDEIDTHTTQLGGLYFGTDDDGAWGYATTSAGDITPFRNPTGNATAAQLLSGYVASNATTEDFSGTMNNWGSNTVNMSSNTATLSAGYYSSISINAASRYTAGYNSGYSVGYAVVNNSITIYVAGSLAGPSSGSNVGMNTASFTTTIKINAKAMTITSASATLAASAYYYNNGIALLSMSGSATITNSTIS